MQVVLGVAGAAIGGAVGGPAGARIGWAVGTIVGGWLSRPKGTNTEVGKLSDLKVSGSSYGAFITQVWGRVKVPGTIIWAKTDANGNHLVEHREKQSTGGGKGGGGGGSATTFWYSSSFAVGICAKGRFTTADIKTIWGDDLVLYDSASGSNTVTPTFYDGGDTQLPDPLISAWASAFPAQSGGAAPAFRDLCYMVIEDLDLRQFSNRLPNITIQFAPASSPSVGDLIEDLALQASLLDADLDVSGATEAVDMYIDSLQAAKDGMAPVLMTFFYDLPEVDAVLRAVKRGGSSTLTVEVDDLGSAVGGPPADNSTRAEETFLDDAELPRQLTVNYLALDNKFDAGNQGAMRQIVDNDNVETITLQMTLTDDAARQFAEARLYMEWLEGSQYVFSLPPRYLATACADVIDLPVGEDNEIKRVRITQLTLGCFSEIAYTAVLDDDTVITQAVAGGTSPTGTDPVYAPVPSKFLAWSPDIAARDEDGLRAGFYLAATGADGWRGGTIYYSPDGGTTWLVGGRVRDPAVFGASSASLSASGAVAETFDTSNTVAVVLESPGELSSSTETEVEHGVNNAYLGDEIIGVATATLTSALHYTLSDIWRGLRGTTMSGHTSSDMFVLLSPAVVRVEVSADLVGQPVDVKVVSDLQTIADVTAQTITIATPVYPYVRAGTLTIRVPPVETPDGSRVDFTIPDSIVVGSEEVFLNGVLQEPGSGNDYTISASVVTFATAPASTDRIRFRYQKAS